MRRLIATPPPHLLLRRVAPGDREVNGQAKLSLFSLRRGESGLSVYQVASCRLAFEALLRSQEDKLKKAPSAEHRDRSERWFARNGRTVEALVRKGWRLIAFDADDVRSLGFTVTRPDERGHCEIRSADPEAFERLGFKLRERAYLLNPEQCLC